jgi:hypothetical protein
MSKLRLKKDLIFKAGTEFEGAPTKIALYGDKHWEHIFGLSEWFEIVE